MTQYRFYFLRQDGHVFHGLEHEAPDDLSALEAAVSLATEHAMEVWQGSRCVAKLRKGGDAEMNDAPAAHQSSQAQR